MMKSAYKSRTLIIFLVLCSAYLLIILNLYRIQIHQRHFFSELATKQYTVSITTWPPRGFIYDRSGTLCLALNKDSYTAFITPRSLGTKEATVAFLHKQFPAAYDRFEHYQDKHFMYVKRRLTEKQIALIQESKLSDIKILKEPNRFYPVESAGIVTGFTNIDNRGICGIEQLFDTRLAGSQTTITIEKDARSNHLYLRKKIAQEGTPPDPVTLTLDNTLQFLAYEEVKQMVERFKAREGAALIVEPESGDIVAMVQYPDIDPNTPATIDNNLTRNIAACDAHELGSVMKIFTAMAALEEEVVTPDEIIDCGNTHNTKINKIPVSTVLAHGKIPFSEVIKYSNNIGIVKVANRLQEKLYNHLVQLGFGTKTGIRFPGEQEGFVNPPRNWSAYSVRSLSFGYESRATLLQLARALCVIANDGYETTLRLVKEPAPQTLPAPPNRLYRLQTIEAIKDILEDTARRGTARYAHIKGYRIMGKTGTTNMLNNKQYDATKNLYVFGGIVEKDGYKRVIVTFIRESAYKNIYAATVTAPLFARIAEKMVIHDGMIAKEH